MFKYQKISQLMADCKLQNKKFTKSALCDHIGLTTVGLDGIINGKSSPKISTLEKIADYFNVDMNYFFDQYESKPLPEYNFSEPKAEYNKENPWKLCFELQKEITELRVELERCEKFIDARDVDTKTG